MKEMKEMKEIPGHPNYKITTDGEVWSFKGKKPRKIKESNSKGDYLIVILHTNGKKKVIHTHKLMAITYLNHKPSGLLEVVDHINNDRRDNRLENLQLITNRENVSRSRNRDLPTGVDYSGSRFMSRIYTDGKSRYLGTFNTPGEASKAYQDALAMLK